MVAPARTVGTTTGWRTGAPGQAPYIINRRTTGPTRNPGEAPLSHLSITSWNIHRGRGEDGVTDPARTADVLCREVLARPADLLILQEADAEAPPHRGILDLSEVETRAGLAHAHLRKIDRWGAESHGFHGVILLAGPHVRVEDLALVDLPGQCHRGAVIADVTDAEGRPVRVVGGVAQ